MRWPMIDDDDDDDEEQIELEAHHILLNDKWRQLFDKFDPEGFGEIPWDELMNSLESPEFQEFVDPGKREILAMKAGEHKTAAITFDDFVSVMSGKRSRSFKLAVHHQRDFRPKKRWLFSEMVKKIAREFLPDEQDRRFYADHYTCCPPPFFILLVTLIELGTFAYYSVTMGQVTSAGPVPTDSVFIYRPDKRSEVWRFVLYMVIHSGCVHLVFNLLVQLLVGLPLEMVHGSVRIGAVYMAGVLAGSLGTSIFDTEVYLVGASGGVYALLAAHLANVLLNYNQMEFGLARLVGIFVIASADVGFAVYSRYSGGPPISYVAHLTGALAGLTIGLLVLKNFEQKLHEQMLWWLALGVYAACILFAILFNIFK